MTAPVPATDPTPTATDPAGATPPAPVANPPAPTATPDEPLTTDGGKKALQAERDRAKALERELAALAPLKKLAEALGAGTPAANGKSEIELLNERFAKHEEDLASERLARWKAEVAADKKLPTALAARLQGSTKEELEADADALAALIPAGTDPGAPRTPAPDPSQGSRGGAALDLDAQIAEAEKAGRWQDVIALKRQRHSSK